MNMNEDPSSLCSLQFGCVTWSRSCSNGAVTVTPPVHHSDLFGLKVLEHCDVSRANKQTSLICFFFN